MSPLKVINLALGHWRKLVGIPAAVTVVAVALWFLGGGPDFTATSVVQPELGTGGSMSNYAGIAAQFGVDVPTGESGESLSFYARLLKSREVLDSTVMTTFTHPDGDGGEERGNLIELLGVKGRDDQEMLTDARKWLDEQSNVDTDLDAGVITLITTAPDEQLAMSINRRMLDLLNSFNLERRQRQGSYQRRFLEERRSQAEDALNAAENALEQFMIRNRTANSPSLMVEQAQLQRRIELRQQLFVSLSQAYEDARVQEVRSIPVVTVLDPPEGSAEKRGSLLMLIILTGFAALLLTAAAIIVSEAIRRDRQFHPNEYMELRSRVNLRR